MKLYEKNGITISTIENDDKEKVLEYFSENSFNCDYESGSLRPSNTQFIKIMDDIILGKDDESNILVLKKNKEVIGYLSMFVEYDRLNLGHIAIKKTERKKGYGNLLTRIAILIAENEERDVELYCLYPNKYLKTLGFETSDDIHYLYKRKGIKNDDLPQLFVSVSDYKIRKEKEFEEERRRFANFLNSDIMRDFFDNSDKEYNNMLK